MEAKREYLQKKLETNQLEADLKFANFPELLKNRLEYLRLRYDINLARLDKSDKSDKSEKEPVKEKTPPPQKTPKIQIKVEAPRKQKEKSTNSKLLRRPEAVMTNIL